MIANFITQLMLLMFMTSDDNKISLKNLVVCRSMRSPVGFRTCIDNGTVVGILECAWINFVYSE